jgi:hypothetical protein
MLIVLTGLVSSKMPQTSSWRAQSPKSAPAARACFQKVGLLPFRNAVAGQLGAEPLVQAREPLGLAGLGKRATRASGRRRTVTHAAGGRSPK